MERKSKKAIDANATVKKPKWYNVAQKVKTAAFNRKQRKRAK